MAVVVEKTGGGSGGPPPEIEDGTYAMACYKVDDTVTWPAGDFGFGYKEERPAVELHMMISDVLDPDGNSVIIPVKVTLSMHENATLRRYAKALLGRDSDKLDTDDLVGATCLGTVEHPNGDWPRITNMTAMPKAKVT